jgi:hypothetical protein
MIQALRKKKSDEKSLNSENRYLKTTSKNLTESAACGDDYVHYIIRNFSLSTSENFLLKAAVVCLSKE